jgi:hypothetical protein
MPKSSVHCKNQILRKIFVINPQHGFLFFRTCRWHHQIAHLLGRLIHPDIFEQYTTRYQTAMYDILETVPLEFAWMTFIRHGWLLNPPHSPKGLNLFDLNHFNYLVGCIASHIEFEVYLTSCDPAYEPQISEDILSLFLDVL